MTLLTLSGRRRFAAVLLAVTAAVPAAVTRQQVAASGPRFEITFTRAARAEPVTGRVYVAISRTNSPTPIVQASPTGAPLFSRAVEAQAPDQPAVIGASDLGHPVKSLRDVPAGEYWVQPFVNVYTKFARADGKTVWLHMAFF